MFLKRIFYIAKSLVNPSESFVGTVKPNAIINGHFIYCVPELLEASGYIGKLVG